VDDGAGEGSPAPWKTTFPHALTSAKGVPDNEFVSAWERSPQNDVFLTDLAIHLLRARKLGTGTGTDVLTLSLPNLDHIAHEYGPRSWETQDILLRIDANIGRLLDALDEQVPGRYTVGFSSDHGVMHIPEQLKADGLDAGRISSTAIQKAVNAAVAAQIGVEDAVASIWEQQIALAPGVFDALRKSRNGLGPIKNAIRSVPGVQIAYSSDDVLAGDQSKDPLLRAWRLSQVHGRTGDFFFVMKPNYIVRSTSGTTHGTMREYDQRVPLVFFGARIKPGRYDQASTPADLAPTFAALAGITMPQARGRAVSDVIVR
jgi:predicted AlkP superfamily pyrophosphatase or phosphodiesterase